MWIIKRQTNSWSRRGPTYRAVKGLEFPTEADAQAWIDDLAKRNSGYAKYHHVEKAATKKDRGEHHCQICERQIEDNTGVISHHGYERPGYGWQTSSCFGARYRAYEIACDALPPAITNVTEYRDRMETALRKITKNPPKGFEISQHDYNMRGHPARPFRTVLRPVSWPNEPDYVEGSYEDRVAAHYFERKENFQEYAQRYNSERARLEQQIRFANDDIKRLSKRLADWKPLTTAKDRARKAS